MGSVLPAVRSLPSSGLFWRSFSSANKDYQNESYSTQCQTSYGVYAHSDGTTSWSRDAHCESYDNNSDKIVIRNTTCKFNQKSVVDAMGTIFGSWHDGKSSEGSHYCTVLLASRMNCMQIAAVLFKWKTAWQVSTVNSIYALFSAHSNYCHWGGAKRSYSADDSKMLRPSSRNRCSFFMLCHSYSAERSVLPTVRSRMSGICAK